MKRKFRSELPKPRPAERLTITFATVEKLWEKQEGCCAVTGMPMIAEAADKSMMAPFRPSLDRIVPNRGYVSGNVRLVATIVNSAIGEWGLDPFLTMCRAAVARHGEQAS